jgi:hypothetical protein
MISATADQDAQHGEETAQLVRSNRIERKPEVFAKILPHRNHQFYARNASIGSSFEARNAG